MGEMADLPIPPFQIKKLTPSRRWAILLGVKGAKGVVRVVSGNHARNHNILGLREDVNLFLRGEE